MSSTLMEEDKQDIHLANRIRLSLTKPTQSSFRVLALLFYAITDENKDQYNTSSFQLPPWVSQRTTDGRTYIVGTNDEPGYMGGAICAERSAMVQLRFAPNFRITKLVICTDSLEPIAPGMLCREFLAGHDSVPWDLRVISTGCICIKCSKRDEDLFSDASNPCRDGSDQHVFPTLETSLDALYPHPSPYTRLNASQSVTLGESYLDHEHSKKLKVDLDDRCTNMLELAVEEAKSNVLDNHPIHFGAAVVFEDGSIATSHQSSALEYGCTLDAVSQLAPSFKSSKSPPKLLVQADQYGVCHAPFAPARAFLSEHGYGDCRMLVHEMPKDYDSMKNIQSWSFKRIQVLDLAPNSPDWTTSTDRPTKKCKITMK